MTSSENTKQFIRPLLGSFFAILLLGGAALVIFFSQKTDLPGNTGENGAAIAIDESPPIGPQLGYLAPDFALQDMDGNSVSLSDYRGRSVLINFWATWCPPCVAEMPALQDAQEIYQESGFIILAINASYSEATALDVYRFALKQGLTFPILMDTHASVADQYYIDSYPISFFIDPEGIIQRIQYGSMKRAEMFIFLDDFLGN